jgi:hypothetical protein
MKLCVVGEKEGEEFEVDGAVDAAGIEFIGNAVWHSGEWVCLAKIGTALCRVAVRISAKDVPAKFRVEAA